MTNLNIVVHVELAPLATGIQVKVLHGYLKHQVIKISDAIPFPGKGSSDGHIYYAGPTGYWLRQELEELK